MAKTKVDRCTDLYGRECSDFEVGGWVTYKLSNL